MRIVVFGSGQIGNTVAATLTASGHQVLGAVDDAPEKLGQEFYGIRVLGDRNWLLNNTSYDAVCVGVGTSTARRAVCEWLHANAVPTTSSIHPSANISDGVTLGRDLVIGANLTLFTNPEIGDGCFIGPSVTISHDSVIGKYCLISAGSVIGARCDIADEVLIGTAATLMPPAFRVDARLQVGKSAIVGVGATVIGDVKAKTTVIGTPARPIAKRATP